MLVRRASSRFIQGRDSFGILNTVALDDQVDAQPLVVSGQTINGHGIHNVLYVATESNTIYAIDATSGEILLKTALGPPVPQSALPGGCSSNAAHVGINSTPAIDSRSETLYVITYTFEQSSPVYRLHALGLRDLKDKAAPIVVEASHKLSDGTFFSFSAHTARQRAALVLNAGNVYAGFGSFCDIEANNSRGWVLGWNADSLTPLPANRLNDTQANSPNDYFLSSIWMSGAGIAFYLEARKKNASLDFSARRGTRPGCPSGHAGGFPPRRTRPIADRRSPRR